MSIKLLLPLLTGLAWSLVACGPSPEQQAVQTATALTGTAAMWTNTPTTTATFTPTPTLTLTPTSTLTPSITLAPTFTPTQTPDPDRFYPPGTSISLVPPIDWMLFIEGEVPAVVGPEVGNLSPQILFFEERNDMMLGWYTAQVQDGLSPQVAGYKQIGEEFLTTPAGLPYFRWEFQGTGEAGTVVRFVMYFFENNKVKSILQYLRPMNGGVEFDEQVEEAIKSVRFEKGS